MRIGIGIGISIGDEDNAAAECSRQRGWKYEGRYRGGFDTGYLERTVDKDVAIWRLMDLGE